MNITMRSFRAVRLSALALALGCCGAFATAHAADAPTAVPTDAPRVTVDFADLDLSRPAGAEMLYQRLRGAASRVCGDADARRVEERAHRAVCREQAIARAVVGIRSPAFAAWYAAKTGRTTDGQLVAGAR